MTAMLNILWKKDSSDSNLYVDIFAIKRYEIQSGFQKAPRLSQRSNMLAEVSRERGKQYFGKGQLFEAMEEFNNCLALAEIGTNEMGLAFANRSACYVRMNMPMNAMTDIDLAKAANYPPQLMHKLNDRYQKCFLRLTTETFQPAIFRVRDLRLSFNEHDKFEGVADCLKIQRNMAYGRHIITKCDLQIGQIVLHEKPYSIVPNQSSMSYKNRCTHCFEVFKNFITCNQCGAYFCSSEGCLEMSYHKHICNIPYSGPKHTFDLVLQMLFEINDAYKGVDQLLNAIESLRKGNYYMADLIGDQQKAFCSIFQMNHNHEKQSDEQMQSLLQASACAYQRIMHIADFNRKFVTKKHRRFLKHLILHLFHIAKYAIDLYDYRQEGSGDDGITKNHTFQMFGSGIYPIGSYISHSCNPNVLCYASCFSYMVCQVIRPIKKGEQLFRSYFPPLWELDQHRSLITKLQHEHHFKCGCMMCTENIRLPTADEVNFTTNQLYKDGIALTLMTLNQFRKLPLATIERHEKSAIQFLELYGRFHPINETINMKNALLIMWCILAKDYSH